ncbi:hypothetical protein A3844_02305 [Paenibacillus helianthi]|uniref:Uncharacterized protein n=1 Tax=Paenibacillus helianthi TaxID=1349432 RepID=A0ABX3EUT0_9BACL|nr:hypothetical protein [Paenibacillus helianthi]OKP91966.1 hypothetical protein A3844_02305 [Paenibacillus helianthi]
MSNNVKKITALTAALLLCLAPAAAFAENTAGRTPSATPDSAVHAEKAQPRPHAPHMDKGFRAGGGHFIINETSKLLEMDRAELIRSLRAGKTLYALAREKKGWTEDQYIQKLSEAASLKLEASITNGQVTREEANKLKASLPALLKLSISRTAHFQESQKPSNSPRAKDNR